MTNHHVFGKPTDAANSLADFDYELDVFGMERVPVSFGFEPKRFFYTNARLDFSIVAIASTSQSGGRWLADWGWLPLSAAPGKADPGEYLTIIQHPSGQMKQVCVRENKLLRYTGDFVWYLAYTTAGWSGSPVFNRFWQVIALHHSGFPKRDLKGRILTNDGKFWDASMDETSIDWVANEGVRVSAVVVDLKIAVGSHPLIRPLLDELQPVPAIATEETVGSPPTGPAAGMVIEPVGSDQSTSELRLRNKELMTAYFQRYHPVSKKEASEDTRKDLTYTLWYGTNRQPNDPQKIIKGFSGKR